MSENVQEVTATETSQLAEDIVLERGAAQALYLSGFMDVHPERWTRLRELVRFDDVVSILTGSTQLVISCPFHGRDSKPSFNVYRRTNDAFCFGCPPGKQYYDHVIFTAAKLGGSKLEALNWLEKKFDLPPMADVDMEEYEEEHAGEFTGLTFEDLKVPFIDHAAQDVAQCKDLDLAKGYLEILFDAWPSEAAIKENKDAGDVVALGRMLDKTVCDYILARKVTSGKSVSRRPA